jgi:HAE1 family hydrophobic/amphiphilic exporter-1
VAHAARIARFTAALVLSATASLGPATAREGVPPAQIVTPPVPNVDAGYRAPAALNPSPELVGVAAQPFVGLTLDDAIAMALARNTDLVVSQENRRIAGYRIVAAQGAYDVRFVVQPAYQYAKSAPQSPFQSGPNGGAVTQITVGANGGISGETTTGQRYSISATGQRVTTDSTGSGFSPYYPTALGFNLTQPLLRGRYDQPRRQLELARISADSSTDGTLLNASNIIANVSDGYWDLVAAWRNLAIQEEALRQAHAQAQSNARLVRAGASAPVEVVESNTQVNVFQDDVYSALQNVARLQNQLKGLTLSNPVDPIWTANLVPTTPARNLGPEPKLDDIIVAALRNRPEVGQLREQGRSNDVDLAYAKDQVRPQLDVGLGYTTNGFAGQPADFSANPFFAAFGSQVAAINALIANADKGGARIPPVSLNFPPSPAYVNGGFGQSSSNLLNNRFPTYQVSATLGVPIGNRTAKADLAIANEMKAQTATQEVALIQRIEFEARNAVQGLRSDESRLNAARAARQTAELVYASEVRKFKAGTSTTYLVLQRQTNLAMQRGRELQAQTDLNKAVVELERVSGTILANHAVDVTKLGTTPPTPASLLAPKPVPTPEPSP